MELLKMLKLLGRALPVIVANGPVIAEAVRQIREALRKPPAPQPVPVGPVSGVSVE